MERRRMQRSWDTNLLHIVDLFGRAESHTCWTGVCCRHGRKNVVLSCADDAATAIFVDVDWSMLLTHPKR